MPGRSKPSSSLKEWREIIQDLTKDLAEKFPGLAPAVVEEIQRRARAVEEKIERRFSINAPALADEILTVLRHPRTLGTWLEGHSPWLNRKFLSAASNVIEPFLGGMGLRVESLSESSVEVSMPGGRRNQGESGLIHVGALSALGEFTSRLFWEHHLDLRRSELELKRLEIRILSRASGDLRGVFRLPISEREGILHRLRADSRVSVDSQVSIYGSSGLLLAEVDLTWAFARHLALRSAESDQEF